MDKWYKIIFKQYILVYCRSRDDLEMILHRSVPALEQGLIEHFFLLVFALYRFISPFNVLVTVLCSIIYLTCRVFYFFRLDRLGKADRLINRIIEDNPLHIEACVFLIFFALLLPHIFQQSSILSIYTRSTVVFFLWFRMVDIIFTVSSVAFFNRLPGRASPMSGNRRGSGSPVSGNRSTILLLINFFEIILCFSLLYLSSHSIATKSLFGDKSLACLQESFYFSVVTITTLGYGDFRPVDSYGQFLVTTQILIGYL